jgi:hypothetical protein
VSDASITEAVAGLKRICGYARVLGSYRAGGVLAAAARDPGAAEKHSRSSRHGEPAPSLHSGATDG